MAGHALAVERLLEATGPLAAPRELFEWTDCEGMRALDYAVERGLPEATHVLVGEQLVQEESRLAWKRCFEPSCRSSLNVSMCSAWLEISRPEFRNVDRFFLRLECRVVDALHLVEGYTLEVSHEAATISSSGGKESRTLTTAIFARGKEQKAIDDVEFRTPRRIDGQAVWSPGTRCSFRVIGKLAPDRAGRAGYPFDIIRSPWTTPTWIPG
jgi:hypothetical protein